ncbi:YlbF family regulator [Romboutsia sedimentorum]|jgi:cell fate (sporulation/competence/biofilm development) regulator YlbF (YheA/YmcA/DUF963 family)|uniref:YlbF family regulator n=1 Tax=Romboutsia sedimentorum TaxID=1368474 RepID=A0ABT7E9A0_9FIRM|nr:YlbF family regulator [Romboutsia sedimentorum]MDK2563257.1 YlbF family regulator [Romboutsia sedimentorum]MDK2584984.1 YlbF family regulator [Romboutsia sedimentorum]
MSVNDSAIKLANEIKNSKEYKDFRKYMKDVKNDKECEKLLKDYREIQIKIQTHTIKNVAIDKKTMNKIESTQKRVSNNKKLSNYLTSEQKFTLMMNNINKILAQAVEKDYK